MLEAIGLHKRYGDLVAVHEATFRAEPGQILGLLGPNGAGKTTTVAMIAGILKPDRGEVRVYGSVIRGDTDPVKRRIGLVPQELALHEGLSARDNLELFGAFYGLRGAPLEKTMQEALELTGLADRIRDRVGAFSGGMKRRSNLAAALLHSLKRSIFPPLGNQTARRLDRLRVEPIRNGLRGSTGASMVAEILPTLRRFNHVSGAIRS